MTTNQQQHQGSVLLQLLDQNSIIFSASHLIMMMMELSLLISFVILQLGFLLFVWVNSQLLFILLRGKHLYCLSVPSICRSLFNCTGIQVEPDPVEQVYYTCI